MRMRPCNGCGGDIRLIKTEAGKWMPIDPSPLPSHAAEGLTVITASGKVVANAKKEWLVLVTEQLFTPHWKNCPAADRFRRRA